MTYCWILQNCYYSFLVNKLHGKILFFILVWCFALFSLPNNLFCVDNVRRVYLLIDWLEPKGLSNTTSIAVFRNVLVLSSKDVFVMTKIIERELTAMKTRTYTIPCVGKLPISAPLVSAANLHFLFSLFIYHTYLDIYKKSLSVTNYQRQWLNKELNWIEVGEFSLISDL